MVTLRALAMLPSVETGGAFFDFSTLDRYPLLNPVCRASPSRVSIPHSRSFLIWERPTPATWAS